MNLSLSKQIFIALFLFTLLFITLLSNNIYQSRIAVALQQSQSLIQAVSIRSIDLAKRADIYDDVAPRDFPDYNRDVQLFYPAIQADLLELETAVNALSSVELDTNEATSLQNNFANFRQGFWDSIGNKEEPRLEWAAEYLGANALTIRDEAIALENLLDQKTNQQLDKVNKLARLTWLLALIAIGLILLWFWLRVSKRVKQAADSCLKVAQGEFGTRLEDKSTDELGLFSSAFNSLSSRTRVVLGVIDKLPADSSTAQAFSTIWDESHEYLGHQWQGLFALNTTLSSAKFLTARQHSTHAFQFPNASFAINELVSQLNLSSNNHGFLENIREHTLNSEQAKILRTLSRRNLTSLAFVVLKNPSPTPEKEHLLLIFAWDKFASSQVGVASFLGSLSKFLHKALLK